MKFKRESQLPYPQPWEWIRDNIEFEDQELFFVDVGAHDGISSSNTGYFEIELGWDGICIEPNSLVFDKLKENRNCKLYNCCAGSENKEVDFLLITGYAEMLSGIYSEYDKNHLTRIDNEIINNGGKKELIKVKSYPLKEILKENNVKKIDYLSIDVENAEMEVLKGINFSEVDIRVISIENCEYNDSAKKYLIDNGYQWIHKCCSDDIFIKKYE